MPIINQQHSLAEEFHANDILVIRENHEATLKIKRWKFIHSLSTLSKTIRQEADHMIQNSFLSFIESNEVLLSEGFFESQLEN
jgi:hypothetical protein